MKSKSRLLIAPAPPPLPKPEADPMAFNVISLRLVAPTSVIQSVTTPADRGSQFLLTSNPPD